MRHWKTASVRTDPREFPGCEADGELLCDMGLGGCLRNWNKKENSFEKYFIVIGFGESAVFEDV